MSFVETVPAALDAGAARGMPTNGWLAFQVSGAPARVALLRDLSELAAPVSIGRWGGEVVAATLWSVDAEQQCLHFSGGPELAALAARPEGLFAAAYLGDDKLQFPLHGIRVADGGGSADARFRLRCELPSLLLRLARRGGLRLRRVGSEPLLARAAELPGGFGAAHWVEMPVLDIGKGGCALWLPAGAPELLPGMLLRAVEWQQAGELLFCADLKLCHVGSDPQRPTAGLRLGCSWGLMSKRARTLIDGWLERGQRRRTRFTLSLDLEALTMPLRAR
ncbi:MAG: hypothetical protein LCI02_23100 [Proteobacteria bacterium]|nr:hypothetical protein [Pseudomonadota bacterium]